MVVVATMMMAVMMMVAVAVMVTVAASARAGIGLWERQHGGEAGKNQDLRKPGEPVKEAFFLDRVRSHRIGFFTHR